MSCGRHFSRLAPKAGNASLLDSAGRFRAQKGRSNPRNLYAKLRRNLQLKTLRLAVPPGEK